MHTRAIAARILTRVIRGRTSLTAALADELPQIQDSRDSAFIQEVCYGVTRWFHTLEFILRKLVARELRSKDFDIKMLLLCGLYQLEYLAIPDHAAVSATVEACRDLQKPWASRLLNAVLRRYQRERSQLMHQIDGNTEAKYAHPQWLMTALREDWPGHWQTLIEENNRRPPMFVRVNRLQTTRPRYMEILHETGIEAEITPHSVQGIHIKQAVSVNQLPGFDDGLVSVQDLAAQQAADLLDLAKGQRVLDACAAPGGKTAHILEQQESLNELVAVDQDRQRIAMLNSNLQRLKLSATSHNADAARTGDWWDGRMFDRILIDAPCSATGVIRRHPDIKLLRRMDDIQALVVKQYDLLSSLWPVLKKGGLLVYVTCSVLARENSNQIERFLKDQADCRIRPISPDWGYQTPYGTQILTGEDNMDGFFYACLEKS